MLKGKKFDAFTLETVIRQKTSPTTHHLSSQAPHIMLGLMPKTRKV